jgi:hypothetical protein
MQFHAQDFTLTPLHESSDLGKFLRTGLWEVSDPGSGPTVVHAEIIANQDGVNSH